MKKILTISSILFFFVCSVQADTEEILSNISNKISESVADMIPGYGITEVSIGLQEHKEPDFSILAVRDLNKTERSNFFTQFSFRNDVVNGDERYIGNLGLGYRALTDDESTMFGANIFYDRDLVVHHQRMSFGLEARASVLEFSTNWYDGITKEQTVSGTEELALSGLDFNLMTQIPHMPWTKFRWTSYEHRKGEAASDTEGDEYALELSLLPALQLDLSRDISNHADGNVYGATLNFVYPPLENKPTLLDGFITEEVWTKVSMVNHLSDKVQRNNTLVTEVQGSVIITSK